MPFLSPIHVPCLCMFPVSVCPQLSLVTCPCLYFSVLFLLLALVFVTAPCLQSTAPIPLFPVPCHLFLSLSLVLSLVLSRTHVPSHVPYSYACTCVLCPHLISSLYCFGCLFIAACYFANNQLSFLIYFLHTPAIPPSPPPH